MANADVDAYLERSRLWPDVVAALRSVLLECGLSEELKWRKPCYVHDGKNIAIVQEMKDFCALMFFKGGLLSDPDGVLVDVGPNSRAARRMTFTSADEVERLAATIGAYVAEAIALESSGAKPPPPPEPEWAAELVEALDRDPTVRAAFEALTPGRRREYNLHFTGAKQSATRQARVERAIPRILAGKGLRDR